MLHAVEVPGAVRHVGSRLAEEQPLAEITPARKLDLASLGLVRVARERVEPLAVFHARPQQSWARVEPAQKSIVNPGRIHAPSLDASVRQPAAQAEIGRAHV